MIKHLSLQTKIIISVAINISLAIGFWFLVHSPWLSIGFLIGAAISVANHIVKERQIKKANHYS